MMRRADVSIDRPEQVRLNHVGDWGTQFGMLISHLKEVAPEAIEDGAEEKARGNICPWLLHHVVFHPALIPRDLSSPQTLVKRTHHMARPVILARHRHQTIQFNTPQYVSFVQRGSSVAIVAGGGGTAAAKGGIIIIKQS